MTGLAILVHSRCDQRAAERFFRRLPRGQGKEPFRIVTDNQEAAVPPCERSYATWLTRQNRNMRARIVPGATDQPVSRATGIRIANPIRQASETRPEILRDA